MLFLKLATPIEDGSESAQPYLTHQENIFRALKMIDKDAHSLVRASIILYHLLYLFKFKFFFLF